MKLFPCICLVLFWAVFLPGEEISGKERLEKTLSQWQNEVKSEFLRDNDLKSLDDDLIYLSKYIGVIILVKGDYKNLSSLKKLTYVNAIEITNGVIDNLDFMNGSCFEELIIYDKNNISNINGLRNTRLILFFMDDASKITDIKPLLDHKYFEITLDYLAIKDFSDFTRLNTKSLRLWHAQYLKDITPLVSPNIEDIDVAFSPVSVLPPLAANHKITRLFLRSTKVSDLKPLAGNSTLTALDISDTQVRSLSPLKGMPLEYLSINGAPIEDPAILSTLKQLKSLVIDESQRKSIPPDIDRNIIGISRQGEITHTLEK